MQAVSLPFAAKLPVALRIAGGSYNSLARDRSRVVLIYLKSVCLLLPRPQLSVPNCDPIRWWNEQSPNRALSH